MKKFYTLFILLLASSYLFSQSGGINKRKEIAHDIVLEESGIHAVSNNASDSIVTDVQRNTVLYRLPDSVQSFWYKLFVKENCTITFEIFPTGAGNIYNFFLYKTTVKASVSEIEINGLKPIRANLFKDAMYSSGTGLSVSSTIISDNSDSSISSKDFYHTPYHAAVTAKHGDVYFLNIYHVKGNDCGFRFSLNANNHSQKFRSIYPACYVEQLKKLKTISSFNLNSLTTLSSTINSSSTEIISPRKTVEMEEVKTVFIVRDSITQLPVDAEITWAKKYGKLYIVSKEIGKYEFIPEKNTSYQVVFSAVGYKSKNVLFSSKDSIHSTFLNVFLSPYKAGDNFVMDKIYFFANTFSMKPGAVSELDKLISYLKANPGINVEVQGHTSGNKRIKTPKNNKGEEGSFTGSAKKLSQMRADIIKAYLIKNGISESRLTAIGYGGSQMIYPKPKNQMEANKNIRVSIFILPQKISALSNSSH